MPTLNDSFTGGTLQVQEAGQKSKIRFAYTWVDGDTWTIPFTSTLTGDFTIGKGNIAGQNFSSIGKLKDRLYLGFGSTFALSGVGDPEGWEEQNPGAATINYLSQFGAQDTVVAFGSMQGRLAVLGNQSIQMWDVDANPQNFVLQQTMDNTGTSDPLSVQSIGDLDLLYLDKSGVRSLRAKESTLNAYVSDMGTAIDALIRTALRSYTVGSACAIVEPTTRQYWLYLNGYIYVLSYYPQSKITAWSTYEPCVVSSAWTPDAANYDAVTGYVSYRVGENPTESQAVGDSFYWVKGGAAASIRNDLASTYREDTGGFVINNEFALVIREYGTPGSPVGGTLVKVNKTFVPQKFVVSSSRVYVKGDKNKIYLYGGTSNTTFDRCRKTAELPWSTLGHSEHKQLKGVDAAFTGRWEFYLKSNPRASSFVKYVFRGSDSSPSMTEDSTYDLGHFGVSGHGTHVKIKAESFDDTEVKLAKLAIQYDVAEVK